MNLQKLIQFISNLITQGFTGQLRLNFHEGNLSEKLEKKESVRLEKECICGHDGITTKTHHLDENFHFSDIQLLGNEDKVTSPPERLK